MANCRIFGGFWGRRAAATPPCSLACGSVSWQERPIVQSRQSSLAVLGAVRRLEWVGSRAPIWGLMRGDPPTMCRWEEEEEDPQNRAAAIVLDVVRSQRSEYVASVSGL